MFIYLESSGFESGDTNFLQVSDDIMHSYCVYSMILLPVAYYSYVGRNVMSFWSR